MDRKIISVIVIVAMLIGGYYLYTTGKLPGLPAREGDIVNGWWNEVTGECWSASDRPPGIPYPIGAVQPTLFQCCFDQQGYQVDCNDVTRKLGSKQAGAPFALYAEIAPGAPGYFTVSHGITMTNTGNIDLNKVWVEAATWSEDPANVGDTPTAPQFLEVNNAYSQIVGPASIYAVALPMSMATDFPTDTIDLQVIGGSVGNGILYALSLDAKASATGLPDSPKTVYATMFVEQEAIGFSVEINIGA